MQVKAPLDPAKHLLTATCLNLINENLSTFMLQLKYVYAHRNKSNKVVF
jgi:hypothetical protein